MRISKQQTIPVSRQFFPKWKKENFRESTRNKCEKIAILSEIDKILSEKQKSEFTSKQEELQTEKQIAKVKFFQFQSELMEPVLVPRIEFQKIKRINEIIASKEKQLQMSQIELYQRQLQKLQKIKQKLFQKLYKKNREYIVQYEKITQEQEQEFFRTLDLESISQSEVNSIAYRYYPATFQLIRQILQQRFGSLDFSLRNEIERDCKQSIFLNFVRNFKEIVSKYLIHNYAFRFISGQFFSNSLQ